MSIRKAFILSSILATAVALLMLSIGYHLFADMIVAHEVVDLADEMTLRVNTVRERLPELRGDLNALAADPAVVRALTEHNAAAVGKALDAILQDKKRDEQWLTKPSVGAVNFDDPNHPADRLTYYEFEVKDHYYLGAVLFDAQGNTLLGREWAKPKPPDESKRDFPPTARLPKEFVLKALATPEAGNASAVPKSIWFTSIQNEPDEYGELGSRRVLWAVRPIHSAEARNLGAVAIKFNAQRLAEDLDRHPRLLHFLTDEDGVCIVHPLEPLQAGQQAAVPRNARENMPWLASMFEKRELADKKGQLPTLSTAKDGQDFKLRSFPFLSFQNAAEFHLEPSYSMLVAYIDGSSVESYLRNHPQATQNAELYVAKQRELDPNTKETLDKALRSQYLRDIDHWIDGLRKSGKVVRSGASGTEKYAIGSPDQKLLGEIREKLADEFFIRNMDGPFPLNDFAISFSKIFPDPGDRDHFIGLAVAGSGQEFMSDIRHESWFIIWSFVAIILVAFAAALWYSRQLTKPLAKLSHAAARLGKNERISSEELPVGRGDEIGALSKAFRDMAVSIDYRDEQLRSREARTRSIVELAADGIVTVAADGTIDTFNKAAEQMFGYTRQEMIGRSFTELAIDSQALKASLEDSYRAFSLKTYGIGEGPRTWTTEVNARRNDGSFFPAEISASDVQGEHGIYTAIIRDITDRKLAKERLEAQVQLRTAELQERTHELEAARDSLERQTMQLQQANSRLEQARADMLELIRVVSHELKNPLSTVIGYIQELKATELTEDQQQDLGTLTKQVHRMQRLVKDLGDIQKMAIDKLDFELHDVDVPKLVGEIVQGMLPRANEQKTLLELQCAEAIPLVRADPHRLEQVLANLLSNAVKFTRQGKVSVRVGLEPRNGASGICFEVSDSGRGMTPDEMSRLFKPFPMISSRKENPSGTGLGLAICKGLCDKMGGDIRVQSEFGRGSTFIVWLPVRQNGVVAPSLPALPLVAPSPGARPRTPNTVLVIEDEVDTQKLIQRALERQGLRVYTALNGTEGLDLAKRLRPAVITLDAEMPSGLDGWAVLAALKTDAELCDIPVVMVTVLDEKIRGVTLGAADFVTKPIDWNKLGHLLRRYRGVSSPGTVLIVDDDPVSRTYAKRMMETDGWKVIEAADGRQGLGALNETRPTMILLDLDMPDVNGFEVIEALQANENWRTIPVIVITATELTAHDWQSLQGRVTQVLSKRTMSWDELMNQIHGFGAPLIEEEVSVT